MLWCCQKSKKNDSAVEKEKVPQPNSAIVTVPLQPVSAPNRPQFPEAAPLMNGHSNILPATGTYKNANPFVTEFGVRQEPRSRLAVRPNVNHLRLNPSKPQPTLATQETATQYWRRPFVHVMENQTSAGAVAAPVVPRSVQTRDPTPTHVEYYGSSSKKYTGPSGLMLIFNHVKFTNGNPERVGTEEDVKNLRQTFGDFKIKIEEYKDYTKKEILQKVKYIKKTKFNIPFLIIVILTHGERCRILSAKDEEYSLDDDFLLPIMENKKLAPIPVIFIIQACKGPEVPRIYHDTNLRMKFPQDTLLLESTVEGFVATRYEHGSPYIMSLCEQIRLYGKTSHILDIAEKVNVHMMNRYGQVATATKTLTKKFVLGHYV